MVKPTYNVSHDRLWDEVFSNLDEAFKYAREEALHCGGHLYLSRGDVLISYWEVGPNGQMMEFWRDAKRQLQCREMKT